MEMQKGFSLPYCSNPFWTMVLVAYSALLFVLTNAQNITLTPPPTVTLTPPPAVTESSLMPVDVRLTDSIVEVTFEQPVGIWYRIQVAYFGDWDVAAVICRELGLGPPDYADTVFAEISQEYAIVHCRGRELSLKDCTFNVTSDIPWPLKMRCLPTQAGEFDVALVKNFNFEDGGTVLVYVNGQWGPICSGYYDKGRYCDVICRQLGYAECAPFGASLSWLASVFSPPILDRLHCSTGVTSLRDCSYEHLGMNQSCDNPYASYLEVECTTHDGYTDSDDYIGYGDGVEYSRSSDNAMVGGGVSVFVVVVIIFLSYHWRKARAQSTQQARPSRTAPPARANRQVSSPNTENLLPSYEAVRNLSQSTGNDPPRYPTSSGAVYSPYMPEAPPYSPMDQSAYPPPASPCLANDVGEPLTGDPELPTYEEAIRMNPDPE